MIKLGIIGISEGNGHPYSFSAIINGYNDEYMAKSGWRNIYNYLKERDKSDFGIQDTKVTHIWTQDKKESLKIAKASNIPNIVERYTDLIGQVDAVIIARDDYQNHLTFAKPFLENGISVFIDKPLSLDTTELNYFEPFIKNKQLFSASGIKYARELDFLKNLNETDFPFIRATCINNWDKYGIHMLDGIFSVVNWNVIDVKTIDNHFFLLCDNSRTIEITMLGNYHIPLFKFEFFGNEYYQVEIKDYFICFKRLLSNFIDMVKNKNQDSYKTIELMNILIKGIKNT